MKEDAFRKGVPLGGTAPGVVGVSVDWTFDVRTIGDGLVDPGTGRMITSPPSKVRAESLELSSVSGVTASVLTMMG